MISDKFRHSTYNIINPYKEAHMNPVSNFHRPLPGESAKYYCIYCKKSVVAKIPQTSIGNIFKKISIQGRVKCPACKRLCGLDPRIQY